MNMDNSSPTYESEPQHDLECSIYQVPVEKDC